MPALLLKILLLILGLGAAGFASDAATTTGADGTTSFDTTKFLTSLPSGVMSTVGSLGSAVGNFWTGMSGTQQLATGGLLVGGSLLGAFDDDEEEDAGNDSGLLGVSWTTWLIIGAAGFGIWWLTKDDNDVVVRGS